MAGKTKFWNAPAGSKESAQARTKSAASKLASGVKKRRATAERTFSAVRKIGTR